MLQCKVRHFRAMIYCLKGFHMLRGQALPPSYSNLQSPVRYIPSLRSVSAPCCFTALQRPGHIPKIKFKKAEDHAGRTGSLLAVSAKRETGEDGSTNFTVIKSYNIAGQTTRVTKSAAERLTLHRLVQTLALHFALHNCVWPWPRPWPRREDVWSLTPTRPGRAGWSWEPWAR